MPLLSLFSALRRPAAPPPALRTAQAAPTLNLRDINARLGVLHVSAAGLRRLGIEPSARERAAHLYSEDQYLAILTALAAHLAQVAVERAALSTSINHNHEGNDA